MAHMHHSSSHQNLKDFFFSTKIPSWISLCFIVILKIYRQIINCYYMKLQIMSRLSKNQKPKYSSIKEALQSKGYTNTQAVQIHERINEYYSIHTEWINEPQEKAQKLNLREFFNNFSNQCEVKYEPIDFNPQEIRRKLGPILQKKRISSNTAAVTQNREDSISQKITQGQVDPKQNYYYQKTKQKIRKVNSLICLDQPQSNRIDLIRKPGFIKQNKSLKKKESSLQISKALELNKENIDFNHDRSKMLSKCGGKMGLQIDQSKERIANIRRELNEIYQMRNRQGQNKLRLN